jgi:hypothetical protein
MDAKLFRLPTKPNFYAAAGTTNPFDVDSRGGHSAIAAPNARYPGYAAPMADARMVTDYRNHCSRNIPTGKQFATKEWMTKNGLELMRVSRQRQSDLLGSIYTVDSSTVPPPVAVVDCTNYSCERTKVDPVGGIGQERAPQPVPALFGTWEPILRHREAPQPDLHLTSVYEGGRNSLRGVEMR